MNPQDEIEEDSFTSDDVCEECENIDRCLRDQECFLDGEESDDE